MHRDACPCGLVGEELAQLEEGPGMPLVAMFVPNRYPLSNPAEVFESECLARDDGFLHQGLADTVIHVLLEAALPSRILPETAFGVLGVDLLQPLAACVVALRACFTFAPLNVSPSLSVARFTMPKSTPSVPPSGSRFCLALPGFG